MQAVLCPFLGGAGLDPRIFAQAEFTLPDNSVSSPEGPGPSADTVSISHHSYILPVGGTCLVASRELLRSLGLSGQHSQ